MKRLWIGLGLLAAILVAGLWTSAELGRIHTGIAEDLTHSAKAAQSGQWEQADTLWENGFSQWQERWHFSAALADHTVLDEIDGLFAQAKIYRERRDGLSYAALCARLSTAIDALQEGHQFSWWNLL